MKSEVKLSNVTKSFRKERVLKGITHSFEQGKIHGIMGFNGSGKTVIQHQLAKWADAEIKGDKIIISSPEVPEPKAARYAWASWPLISVENKNGLPLRPFSTDHGAYLDYGKPVPQDK